MATRSGFPATTSAISTFALSRPIQYTPIRPEDFQIQSGSAGPTGTPGPTGSPDYPNSPNSPNSPTATSSSTSAPGIAFLNQTLSQITTALNSLLGQGGPVQFPSGLDMQGAKVTGLAPPSSPSDAISAGHATTQFSPAAQQPALDIGGTNTLKGLAYTYGQVQTLLAQVAAIQAALAAGAATSGTIHLAKLTGGGTNGSITVAMGIITGFVDPT